MLRAYRVPGSDSWDDSLLSKTLHVKGNLKPVQSSIMTVETSNVVEKKFPLIT